METKTSTTKLGAAASVSGSLVDMRLDVPSPPICSLLRAGAESDSVFEVLMWRDARQVRGIALTPTQGQAHGRVVNHDGLSA